MTNELLINDLFWTFQGEGEFSGRRALFIRMPYCNLKCDWCDTEFNSYKKISEKEFLSVALSETAAFAVITGGEPMLNKQTPRVIELLRSVGFYIACETNGTVPILDGIDFATVSPKRFSKDWQKRAPYFVCDDAMTNASEFKYVVDHDFDFSILGRHKYHAARCSLSPEFSDLHGNLSKIFDFIKENPKWRISLQTHKWMNVK